MKMVKVQKRSNWCVFRNWGHSSFFQLLTKKIFGKITPSQKFNRLRLRLGARSGSGGACSKNCDSRIILSVLIVGLKMPFDTLNSNTFWLVLRIANFENDFDNFSARKILISVFYHKYENCKNGQPKMVQEIISENCLRNLSHT